MIGPDLFATLALAASIMAPALPPRTDWVGEIGVHQEAGDHAAKLEPDGNFKPVGRLALHPVRGREGRQGIPPGGAGREAGVGEQGGHGAAEGRGGVLHQDAGRLDEGFRRQRPPGSRSAAGPGSASGKTEEALKDYAEAIRLSPEAGAWYGNRGLIHMETKKFDDAIQDFSTGIDLAPTSEVAYRNRAMAYSRKKEFAKAVADYEKVVELNPESAVGQNGLAWLLCTAPGRQGPRRQAGRGVGQEGMRADRPQERRLPGHPGRRLRRSWGIRQGGRVAGEGTEGRRHARSRTKTEHGSGWNCSSRRSRIGGMSSLVGWVEALRIHHLDGGFAKPRPTRH